jgi:hypothetical protein
LVHRVISPAFCGLGSMPAMTIDQVALRVFQAVSLLPAGTASP